MHERLPLFLGYGLRTWLLESLPMITTTLGYLCTDAVSMNMVLRLRGMRRQGIEVILETTVTYC